MRFTKMQGLGNDFVVIDAMHAPFTAEPALLRALADRRYGVGCDQVLVIAAPSAPGADFDYKIYNADGSESGQCGNGARCIARYLRERGLTDRDVIRVRTASSVLELMPRANGQVRVNMGAPRFEPAEVPFIASTRAPRYDLALDGGERLTLGAVSLGNPHAVLEVADVAAAPVAELGAALQNHPAFPQGVNVGFLHVQDAGHARLRVYERGAGETLACGSGACAAVAIGRQWGRLGPRVEVRLPGGPLTIQWQGEGRPLWMTGPAEFVFDGEIEWGTHQRRRKASTRSRRKRT